MSEPAQATINGTDLVAWGDAAIEAGRAISFDIRGPEAPTPIVEQINRLVDLGMAVGMYDSAEIMPTFAIGRAGAAVIVVDEAGVQRGSFATVEAALKHGLTMWEGYRG